MYIIIVGGGKVGSGAARDLIEAGHEICVVERDPAAAGEIADALGEVALLGDGTEVHVQRAAGMSRADIAVAATGRDQANLAVCQVAQRRFRAPRVIARINDPRNERIFRDVGIDHTISATRSIVSAIDQEVQTGAARRLDLRGAAFDLLEISVDARSLAANQPLSALRLPDSALISLVCPPGAHPRLPENDDPLVPETTLLAIARPQDQEELLEIFNGPGRS